MNRYGGGSNSFGTGYVDSLFRRKFNFSPRKNDNETTERIYNALEANRKRVQPPDVSKRSVLDRTFDAMLVGNYTIAGAIDGAIRDDKTVLEGITGGFKAANPFGKGFEEGETTFSDAIRSGLDRAGIDEPKSFMGKATVGTVGFVLDVLLDPTTYMTFGTSALIKGSGKVGTATRTIEALAKENPQFAEGLLKQGALTDEMAESIVKTANSGKKMSRVQLTEEVSEFKRKYNNLIGVNRDSAKGITFGVQNMPFGDKVAKKLGITKEPVTLMGAGGLQKTSDMIGMARSYQAVRNGVYGSRIGAHLSNNAGLKRLAELNPSKLYEYMGAINTIQGKNLDKMARDKEIKEIGTKMLGLSPSEHKQIIKALETPSLWKKVKDNLKLGETEAGKLLKEQYAKQAGKINAEISDITSLKDDILKASDEELKDYKTQIDLLAQNKNITPLQSDELMEIQWQIDDLLNHKKTIGSRTDEIASLQKELKENDLKYKRMYETEGDEVAISKFNDFEPAQIAEHFDGFLGGLKGAKEMASTNKELTGNVNNYTNDLREELSEFLFGRSDFIPKDVEGQSIEDLANIIKAHYSEAGDVTEAVKGARSIPQELKDDFAQSIDTGNFQSALRTFIEDNPQVLNSTNSKMYKHLANKYGYSSIQSVVARTNELREMMRRDRSLRVTTNPVAQEFEQLSTMIAKRNEELAKLKSMSPKELDDYLEEEKLVKLRDELDYLLFGDDVAIARRHKRLIDISEGKMGEERKRIGYYGDMDEIDPAFVGKTKEEAELERFRLTKNDTKYTLGDVIGDKDGVRDVLLAGRQKRIFQGKATPQALAEVGNLRDLKRNVESVKQEYATLVKAYKEAPTPELKSSIKNAREALDKSIDEFSKLKSKVMSNTNYTQALKQSKEISPSEVAFIEKQSEAIVTLANKMFPYHRYNDLTSAQKNMLSMNSYYALRDNRKNLGVEELMTKHFEEQILPKQKQEVQKRFEENQQKLVSETLDLGMGVKLETDQGLVNAVITGKKEAKVDKTRTEVDITHVDGGDEIFVQKVFKKGEKDPRTGKELKRDKTIVVPQKPASTRVETTRTIEYEESLGYYNFTARLADGTEITVDPSKVKGTYVEEMNYQTTVLPAYTKAELEEVAKYSSTLKRRIGGYKGVETRNKKQIAEIDNMLKELEERKLTAQAKFIDLDGVNKTIEANTIELKNNIDVNKGKVAELDQTINDLIKQRDEILDALDNDDAFELFVKREMGVNFDKFMDDVNFKESSRIGLDNSKFSDVVKYYARSLREEFTKAGQSEVTIGKLSEGAFEEMVDRYFPRSLTEDAKKFFNDNPTLAEKYSFVTSDYGFGAEWNPYAKGRNEALRKMTTEEANKFFESEIGLRIFEENIGQAYLNRMLKHSEVMYDTQAMDDLMNRFGHFMGDKPMEGYDAVVNYGQIRTLIREMNNESAKREIFDFFNTDNAVREEMIKMGANPDAVAKIPKEKLQKKEIQEGLNRIFESHSKQNMAKLGLDPKLLAGETVPLIKLTPEQIDMFRANDAGKYIRQINQVTVSNLNQQKQLIMERDEKQLLKLYDKFLTFIKMNQTTIMPSFWVQTKVGNMFQGWLGVGRDVFDIGFNKQALDAVKNVGDITKLREMKPVVSENGVVHHWDDIVAKANTYGVINTDFMTKDFAGHSISTGLTGKKLDPFNTKDFVAYRIGGKITSTIDNSDRLLQFASLLKQGKTTTEASEIVTKHLFDYGDLTDFEKRVMKRIFPYYTWMRKNTALVMRQTIDNTEQMALMAKIHSSINSSNGEDSVDRDFVTGFAQDWIQLPFNLTRKDGVEEPVLFNPKLPYMDLNKLPSGDGSGETPGEMLNATSPLIKLPIELAFNWNSFFGGEIAEEGKPQISPRLMHVASQFAAFNAVKNFVKAEGDDKALALVNTFLGQKMTSYDVEMNKQEVYREAYKQQYQEGMMLTVGKGVVRFGEALEDHLKTNISDIAVELAGRPYKANEAGGELIPIPQERFNELSDAEKKKYVLDDETRTYLNKRAKELEKQHYNEAGIAKRFLWTLVEGEYPGGQTVARINKVVDGDTLRANVNGKETPIRLLMVNTPESVGDYKDNPQPGGVEASSYTKSLVLGKDVKLYIDGKDKYGRITAFVEVGGSDIGKELLQEGLAQVQYADMAQGNYSDRLKQYYESEEKGRANRKY